jgi:hypothetical protein
MVSNEPKVVERGGNAGSVFGSLGYGEIFLE